MRIFFGIIFFLTLGLVVCRADAFGATYSRALHCRNHAIEKESLSLWQSSVRTQIQDLINKRLLQQGDVYALYDTQIFLHNFVTMASRCEDAEALSDIATTLLPAEKALHDQDGGPRWVCTGGDICRRNALLNKEVLLVSVQFNGLLASMINAITQVPSSQRTSAMREFQRVYLPVVFSHMSRWIDIYESRWQKLAKLPREKVSVNFLNAFDDKDMWLLATIADVKGAVLNLGMLSPYHPDVLLSTRLTKMYNHGLEFLRSRLDFQKDTAGNSLAFLDLGAWSRYEDMIYAGYTGMDKPVVCNDDGTKTYRVPRDGAPIVPTVNMDISHARRFVNLFESLSRNEEIMTLAGGERVSQLMSAPQVQQAVANAFAAKVMDANLPLFHTYMDGTNGWYRVDYASGGACREGDGPFSSSYAGPTGGFAFWADQNALIGARMKQIYELLSSSRPEDEKVVATYYSGLRTQVLQRFMFVSSIVNVSF